MKNLIIKKIRENAIKTTSNWPKIKIDKPDPYLNPMMNHACHFNALNEHRSRRAVAIVEVFNPSESYPVAHYINMDSDGKFYDATLGYSWSGVEYRRSKYIHTMDTDDMSVTLATFKRSLVKMSPDWLVKMKDFFGIKDGDCF